jgi:hypothetical protein
MLMPEPLRQAARGAIAHPAFPRHSIWAFWPHAHSNSQNLKEQAIRPYPHQLLQTLTLPTGSAPGGLFRERWNNQLWTELLICSLASTALPICPPLPCAQAGLGATFQFALRSYYERLQ